MNPKVNDLIAQYPDIEWDEVEREILIEIADNWLRRERAKWYADAKVPFVRDEAKVAVESTRRKRATSRNRTEARKVEQRVMFDREKVKTAVSNRVAEIARETRSMISSEWTGLLSTTFVLPDGTRVTWADATIEQHEARAEHLEKQAATRLETASLHRKAISDLRERHVATLGALAA